MTELVETVDSIRDRVFKAHGYVTRSAEGRDADRNPIGLTSFTCSCGETSDFGLPDETDDLVEMHLSSVVRRAFRGTEFDGDPGTRHVTN